MIYFPLYLLLITVAWIVSTIVKCITNEDKRRYQEMKSLIDRMEKTNDNR